MNLDYEVTKVLGMQLLIWIAISMHAQIFVVDEENV